MKRESLNADALPLGYGPLGGRGWRLSLIACGCVPASATIALAATGVILAGAPVRPEVYFGLLGPRAVSVTFQAGRTPVTIPVLKPLGAYLIVRRAEPRE